MARRTALAGLLAACAAPPLPPDFLASAPTVSHATQQMRGTDGTTAVQALLGVSFYDDMTFSRTDPMDPTNTVESDVSEMPTLGIGGHHRLFGNPRSFEGGLDATLLFSWSADSTSVIGAGGGNSVILISTTMSILDIGFGLYGSQMLGDSVRVYVGAGPLVQFGDGDFEDEVTRTQTSGFGVGLYGRGGVEFKIKPGEFIGVGVRSTYSDIDFGSGVGDIDTGVLQVFVTFAMDF